MSEIWTEARIETLACLICGDNSNAQAAQQLRLSIGTVAGKAHRLRIRQVAPIVRELKNAFPGASAEEVAEATASYAAVIRGIWRHLQHEGPSSGYSPEIVALMRASLLDEAAA